MNLSSAFRSVAQKNLGSPAIFYGDITLSYETVLTRALHLSAHLHRNLGVQPGDRVALWLKNCPEFVSAIFGILGSGAVVVPINNFLKPEEVAYVLNDAGINVIITDQTLQPGLAALTALRPGLQAWTVEEFDRLPSADGAALARMAASRTSSDLAVIIYTSGTTGHPKGAMLSHGNLMSNVESCRQVLKAVDADRFVVLLPMFHSFMLMVGIFVPMLIGGSMVVVRSLHPPKNILAEIIQHQGTILPAIPQFFRALASAPTPPSLPLRICLSGGAPLPREIQREFNARMPIPVLEGYGLSEASPVVTMTPPCGPSKDGSIGPAVPGVELVIQDDEGNILAPGQTGELCVRGANVMLGYWNRPEATAVTMRGDWLLTGDIGHGDEDGYFYITDRKKDMLLVNGINVYPREIEEVIYRFPGVREAAVVGVPDARKGEKPVAFVVAAEGTAIDEKALVQFVRGKLAEYKVPRSVTVMAAFPKNATGKILKRALREVALKVAGAGD